MEKRTYFGEPVGYVEDSMHAVVTKDVYPFYFELKNNTQHELCITTFPCMAMGTLKPKERKRIECYSAYQREITAFIKGSPERKCIFFVNCDGTLLGRSHMTEIVAIDKDDGIEITNYNGKTDFGILSEIIKPLEKPFSKITVKNGTHAPIILTAEGRHIGRINAKETIQIGVPQNGILYIDSATKFVEAKTRHPRNGEKLVRRINGCCVTISNGKPFELGFIEGVNPQNQPYSCYFQPSKSKDGFSIWFIEHYEC